MAGRIRDEDIALVRERAQIAEVVGEHLQLRNAGGGELKGLCPFHDEKTPSFHVAPSRGFYHCLAGETRVLTWDGARPIRELAGGTHRVLSRHADWVEAPFRSFGVQRLWKITMTRNRQVKEIFATDEHRWFVRPEARRDEREVFTKDLEPGARLAWTFPGSGLEGHGPSEFGVPHGFAFGDGHREGRGCAVDITPGKDGAMLKWFPNSRTTQVPDRLRVRDLPAFFASPPDLDESPSYLYGWLAGYFAAHGCVASDGTVVLDPVSQAELELVRTLCTRLGIGTSGVAAQQTEALPGREPSPPHRVCPVQLDHEDLTEAFFLLPQHRERFVASRARRFQRGWVVQSVEPTDRVEEVYCATVEDGHAFVLEDNILTSNCFGCSEGGDVISFVMKVEHLSFAEAVERLAARAGVELRYEQGGAAPRQQQGQRTRLVEAHKVAAEFYAEQMARPEARPAREFLAERGFDREAATQFGVGFAPRSWDALVKHLRAQGFTDREMILGGLAREGPRGTIDRFLGRLLWPIHEISGDVIGFGARRLFDDDRIDAKYVNTPETPIYKKSHVLYGLDVAKRDIARRQQAVVVEGYTDVMAAHLAGVPTAVATCGTAFGEDHIRVLRRLLMDQNEFRGEVVFTFDGDEAGQRAAMRAFSDDQRFVTQTYVAVQPDGLDPCDLRRAHGDVAVRDLVASRVPLFEFGIRTTLRRHDLDLPEGRTRALEATVPLVARIRDAALRDDYARQLAGWVGVPDPNEVVHRVRELTGGRGGPRQAAPPAPRGDASDPVHQVEREALKIALQRPALAGPLFDALEGDEFSVPRHTEVRAAIRRAEGVCGPRARQGWVGHVLDEAGDDSVRSLVTEMTVEPLRCDGEPDPRYANAVLARVREVAATRRITAVKSRLQRLNPVESVDEYNRLFGELVALEQHRRSLREQAIGAL